MYRERFEDFNRAYVAAIIDNENWQRHRDKRLDTGADCFSMVIYWYDETRLKAHDLFHHDATRRMTTAKRRVTETQLTAMPMKVQR